MAEANRESRIRIAARQRVEASELRDQEVELADLQQKKRALEARAMLREKNKKYVGERCEGEEPHPTRNKKSGTGGKRKVPVSSEL